MRRWDKILSEISKCSSMQKVGVNYQPEVGIKTKYGKLELVFQQRSAKKKRPSLGKMVVRVSLHDSDARLSSTLVKTRLHTASY